MFELLPGTGVLLPNGAGLLRFGMDADTTRETLAGLGAVRGAEVPDATWAYTVWSGDVELTAHANTVDRPEPGDPLLDAVVLKRPGHPVWPVPGRPVPDRPMARRRAFRQEWRGPAGIPVVLDDVDLFGYPAAEVLEALGEDRYPGLLLHHAAPGGYLSAVTFLAAPAPGAGSRTGAGTTEPDIASYEHMWTTGRDEWQLERTDSGYLVVMKRDPPMYLLMCHDTPADQIIANMLAAGVEIVTG